MKNLLLTLIVILFHNISQSQSCTPLGNQSSYGINDTWIGYVYDNQDLTNYKGYVNEGTTGNPNFDEQFGGSDVNYSTNGCTVYTSTFSVRYKLTKTFTNANYDFTVGGDDGYRLSLDGGATWVINRWNDQGYTTTTYTVALNGTYNMVLEYYENGGDNRVSFSVVTGCSGSENTSVSGTNDVWKGYVYDGTNFDIYKGMVLQATTANLSFDQNFGGSNVMYPTSGCAVQTETFSVRYRLTKTFSFGSYTFIAGGDDGYRLSLDGGNTWVINRWSDQSYNTAAYITNLNGTYNLVLEYYENSGENRISLTVQPNSVLSINLLSFNGRKETNGVALTWDITADSDPLNFVIERSADGISYNPIRTVPGTDGTVANNIVSYHYTDTDPLPGRSFYRLKMNDRNGNITRSHIVVIQGLAAAGSDLQIFPGLVTNNMIYCRTGKLLQQASIKITDVNGRLICQRSIGRLEQGQTIGFSPEGYQLISGTYLVSVSDKGNWILTTRIIVP